MPAGMTARLYDDPAGEARARVGKTWEGRGVALAAVEDAERQVTAMLTGLNELVTAVPMLGEPTERGAAQVVPPTPSGATRGASDMPTPARTPGNQLHELTLAELGERLRTRALSPVEVTQAMLARIQRHDGALRTFITVTADEALEQARAAERSISSGGYQGPLHGVPLAVKDLYDVAGVRTTAGSSILGDWVPELDSAAVGGWRAAGAALLGKNTLHEFAFGGTSVNQHTGTPRNPWNTEHMCGGSSGGSAAAVAAGFAYGTFGSETGNS